MLIEAGYDIAFECPAQTPMLLQLNVIPLVTLTCSRPTASTPIPLWRRAPISIISVIQRLGRGLSRWPLVHHRRAPQPSRIGRIVMGRGRDAADVAISTAFGIAKLARFDVITQEQTQDG
jgi:hypothetical protein